MDNAPNDTRPAGAKPPDRETGRARRDGALSMAIADQVRESILSGVLPSGHRINEVHLARDLGVSRTPTRAALHALAAEGLLDYEANRGFTVRDYSVDSIAEAYEIRAVLEGLACRFAAEHGLSAEAEGAMMQALASGDALIAAFTGTPEQAAAYRAVNVAFHDAVLRAAGNAMLNDMIRITLARPGATFRNIVSFTERDVRRRHDDHHRIFDAIRGRDGWRAEVLMREHVGGVKTSQLRRLNPGQTGAALDMR
jgi:GntR family transcriptional regulator of vanillate catabolism